MPCHRAMVTATTVILSWLWPMATCLDQIADRILNLILGWLEALEFEVFGWTSVVQVPGKV